MANRAANGGIALLLQPARLVAAVAELESLGFQSMAFTDDKDLIELIDASVENQTRALELLKAQPDLIARRNRLNETARHFLVVENYPGG